MELGAEGAHLGADASTEVRQKSVLVGQEGAEVLAGHRVAVEFFGVHMEHVVLVLQLSLAF